MTNILLSGSSGQLARELAALSPQFPDFDFLGFERKTFDITDPEAVKDAMAIRDVHYCINCAAYTAVDKAEREATQAREVNARGVKHLAQACRDGNIPLVHFSTDYVYHGTQNRPFKETDPTNPQGVYAKTKLEGEKLALQIHPGSTIIRTSWLYSSQGHNFVKTMLRLGREKSEVRVVADQIGTPTYAHDLALTVLQIIQKIESGEVAKTKLPGIFNYSNEGVCSWYDFAKAIFDISRINCKLIPIESKDYLTPAPRPFFSLLNKAKIRATFGISIPHWRDSLEKCLQKF